MFCNTQQLQVATSFNMESTQVSTLIKEDRKLHSFAFDFYGCVQFCNLKGSSE